MLQVKDQVDKFSFFSDRSQRPYQYFFSKVGLLIEHHKFCADMKWCYQSQVAHGANLFCLMCDLSSGLFVQLLRKIRNAQVSPNYMTVSNAGCMKDIHVMWRGNNIYCKRSQADLLRLA